MPTPCATATRIAGTPSDTLAKLEAFLEANDDTPVIVGAEEIIDEARNGRMYILVDDEDRENEGDLIIPAQMATPAAINFMATHGRGPDLPVARPQAGRSARPAADEPRQSRKHADRLHDLDRSQGRRHHWYQRRGPGARTVTVAIDSAKGPDDIVTRVMSSRSRRATAACWSARAIPRLRSISRVSRGSILGSDLRDYERGRDDGPPRRPDRFRAQA